VRVVTLPINLRDPKAVQGFSQKMVRYYARNALAVRQQREEDVYMYISSEALSQGFGVTSIGTSIRQ
jgi:hypothetical protein